MEQIENLAVETKLMNCEKHGEYKSSNLRLINSKIGFKGRDKWSECPECHSEALSQEKKKTERETIREKWDRLEAKLEGAGIPKKYKRLNFEQYICDEQNLNQKLILERCKKYAANFDKVLEKGIDLLMTGSVGSGKTHLAMSIANQIIKNGYTVHYEDSYKICNRLSKAARSLDKCYDSTIASLVEPDLLILDEVGDQICSEHELRMLNKLLLERYAQDKPVILISNFPLVSSEDSKDLKNILGSRIISRVLENSGQVFKFEWSDYRPKKNCDDFWNN